MRITLILIAVVVILVLFAGGAWALHHDGYEDGLRESQSKIDALIAQIEGFQEEKAEAVDKAVAKAEERAREARLAAIHSRQAKTQIQSELTEWLTQFQKDVAGCAVAQQSLCPSLQDY